MNEWMNLCETSIPEYGYHNQLATSQLYTNFLLLNNRFLGIEHLHISNNLCNHSSSTLLPPLKVYYFITITYNIILLPPILALKACIDLIIGLLLLKAKVKQLKPVLFFGKIYKITSV